MLSCHLTFFPLFTLFVFPAKTCLSLTRCGPGYTCIVSYHLSIKTFTGLVRKPKQIFTFLIMIYWCFYQDIKIKDFLNNIWSFCVHLRPLTAWSSCVCGVIFLILSSRSHCLYPGNIDLHKKIRSVHSGSTVFPVGIICAKGKIHFKISETGQLTVWWSTRIRKGGQENEFYYKCIWGNVFYNY